MHVGLKAMCVLGPGKRTALESGPQALELCEGWLSLLAFAFCRISLHVDCLELSGHMRSFLMLAFFRYSWAPY